MADHAELLAYLTSIDSKVDQVGQDVKAIQRALNKKVDQTYCVERCQKRWVPRSYLAVSGAVGAFVVGAVALAGDVLNVWQRITGVK